MHDLEDTGPLSEDDIAAHQEAIDHLDVQLQAARADSRLWRELQRERAHLQAELEAGTYLPLQDDEED